MKPKPERRLYESYTHRIRGFWAHKRCQPYFPLAILLATADHGARCQPPTWHRMQHGEARWAMSNLVTILDHISPLCPPCEWDFRNDLVKLYNVMLCPNDQSPCLMFNKNCASSLDVGSLCWTWRFCIQISMTIKHLKSPTWCDLKNLLNFKHKPPSVPFGVKSCAQKDANIFVIFYLCQNCHATTWHVSHEIRN